MLIRSGEARLVGWSRSVLYSGFNILPRSVIRSAYFNGRSDNLDVIHLNREQFVTWILTFGLIAILATWIVKTMLSWSRRAQRVKQVAAELMRGRPSLSAEEFAETHFPSSRETALQIYRFLTDEFIVDVSRVHPNDRLYTDLGLGALDAMSSVRFAMDIEETLGVDITKLLESDTVRVADIVSHIDSAENNGG